MEDGRELVYYADGEGNEAALEVLDYFFYNGDEYAALAVADEAEERDGEREVFFMKVTPLEGDEIELTPVEDGLPDQLLVVFNTKYDMEEDDDPCEV